MPVILCFGDSNTWGNVPGSFNQKTGLHGRYEWPQRWTGVLQNTVGENIHVVEEGINGRTTTLDEIDPGRPYKNGLSLLEPCLEAHYPVDIVVFMLGTNDTKLQYDRSVEEISEGMRKLIQVVKSSNKGFKGNPPKILLIAPHPIIMIPNSSPCFNQDSVKKSERIAKNYQKLAKDEACEFLDASLIVTASHLDGVHLEEHESKVLGRAVAKIVNKML